MVIKHGTVDHSIIKASKDIFGVGIISGAVQYNYKRLGESDESHKALTTIFPFQSISCKSQNDKNEDLRESHGGCLDFQRKAESFACN